MFKLRTIPECFGLLRQHSVRFRGRYLPEESETARRSRRIVLAFTLVELLMVVVILAILAVIVISSIPDVTRSARVNQTATHLKMLADVARLYNSKEGGWPPDQSAGALPPQLGQYVRGNPFGVKVPIGGDFDWNNGWGTFDRSIGIRDVNKDLDIWREVDKVLDDGDLTSGRVVQYLNCLLLKVD